MLGGLVILEHNEQGITAPSLRLMARLQGFRDRSRVKTAALIIGTCQRDWLKTLGAYGIEKAYQVEGAGSCEKEIWPQAVLKLIREEQISLVILPGTPACRELVPGLAAHLEAGVVADCHELSLLGDSLEASIGVYGGQYQLNVKLEGKHNFILMSDIDPGAFEPASAVESAPAIECSLRAVTVPVSERPAVRVLQTYYLPPAELDIDEADVVVGIGRGVQTWEDLEMVREFTAALGATLAGSRPAVDAGFIPFARQIGQTGRLIEPVIYIAIGISGAPQHITGVSEAKIVAINNDPQAPILRLADLGITGDLRKVIPLLTKRIKQLKEGLA